MDLTIATFLLDGPTTFENSKLNNGLSRRIKITFPKVSSAGDLTLVSGPVMNVSFYGPTVCQALKDSNGDIKAAVEKVILESVKN